MKRAVLSHYNRAGSPRMADVASKPVTQRTARARALVAMKPAVLHKMRENPKGDPLEIARTAGILAAKRTWELIPLCHPIPLAHIDVQTKVRARGVEITASVRADAQTGVEMEALTAAAIAALTVYDMTKALDKGIEIREIALLEKTGGKSGDYRRRRERKQL